VSGCVELQAAPEGVRLRVRVKPGARRERLVGAHGSALKLEVATAPERGRANEAVRRLLARALELPLRAIEITAGTSSQDKTVLVFGVSTAELEARLACAGVASVRTGSRDRD
jgi:uncharacterized protein YggU (UPF0235/DUF167 family)